MLPRLASTFALLLALPVAALARPTVVELFTSEGCSSCPPAEAYLSDLADGRHDVLPLAFHVTYWDSLGWKDTYSLDAATQRQATYSARSGSWSYTPEMVVDGKTSFVGSDRAAGARAILAAHKSDETAVTVAGVRHDNKLSIDVGGGTGHAKVLLVGYDREHATSIGRGENSGRTIRETNVVRSIQSIGQWVGAPLKLSVDLPAGERSAVLVEAADGSIIGAARVDDDAH